MKTTTQPKKRGRPVGSKTKKVVPASKTKIGSVLENDSIKRVRKSLEEMNTSQKEIANNVYKVHADNWQKQWDAIPDSEATVEQVKDWSRFKPQGEVEAEMSLANKITLVLTVVNVAILISLVIKNV